MEAGSFFAESLDTSRQQIVFGKKVLVADLQVRQRSFNHSSEEGYLDCIQVGATMNKAAVNIFVRTYILILLFMVL